MCTMTSLLLLYKPALSAGALTHSWLLIANGEGFDVLNGSDAKCKVLQYMTPVDNVCVLTLGAEV